MSYKINVTELKELLEKIDELELNESDALKVKTCIYEFSNDNSVLSLELKKKEKPLFLKVLDSVIPPASESAREYVEPTQKKKKEKPKQKKKKGKPKQTLEAWEDELLGGL